jgi:3-oxoadipate:acetyl-CoA acetyltransferase
MQKLIINAAITGMVPAKDDNPNVPITVDEIIADAKRCRDAGASIVHVHARDNHGLPTYHKEVYRDIITGIRLECPGLLISGSTSGRVHKEFGQRADLLGLDDDALPDFCSLTLGSLNFPQQASLNEPEMIKALAITMHNKCVVPELEIFELGMADYAGYLIGKDVLKGPLYGNIILGSLGTMSATSYNLSMLVRALPDGMVWSAGGIGRYQFQVNALAVAMGGHVRVGLEDNLYYDAQKTRPASNAGLIDRVVKQAYSLEREIASPLEAAHIIGIPMKKGAVYDDACSSGPDRYADR